MCSFVCIFSCAKYRQSFYLPLHFLSHCAPCILGDCPPWKNSIIAKCVSFQMVFCLLPALDASSLVLRLSPLKLCLVSNASAPPLCLICGSVVNFTGVSFPGHFLWAMCSYNVLLRANYAENIRVTHTALYSTLIHSIVQYLSTSVNILFGFWIFWASVSPVLGSALWVCLGFAGAVEKPLGLAPWGCNLCAIWTLRAQHTFKLLRRPHPHTFASFGEVLPTLMNLKYCMCLRVCHPVLLWYLNNQVRDSGGADRDCHPDSRVGRCCHHQPSSVL